MVFRGWAGLTAALVLAGGVAGCMPSSFLVTPVPGRPKLVEHVVEREAWYATDKVAIIDVEGVMMNARPSSWFGSAGDNPVAIFAEKLKRAGGDDQVGGVVIRINSPGGGVTASDLMYSELRRFKRETGKPVVASMLDVAASGGYYLACAADRVYAQPTTVTGSIGVIMQLPEFSGTMQKLGVAVNTIKSGEMKDMGSMFREMSEEDRARFQHIVDRMYERFVDVVAEARPEIDAARLRTLADGRVFLGEEARELGLVDEVGTLRDALAAVKQAAGLADRPVVLVQYARQYEYRPNIYAAGDVPPPQVNLVNVALPEWVTDPAPRFWYLWAPGW
jgi:protease-4